MLQLNIPEEVVNFVQGRTLSGVLAKHYLKLSLLADQYYVKYVHFLMGLVETSKN